MLRKLSALAALSAAAAAAIFFLLPTQQAPALSGGNSRSWVSGVGDDANPCSRTAPCKTFAGAISKTASYGTINCLDPGGFGAVTITKSITIDCHEVYASVLHSGTNGINIAFDSFAVDDTEKTVILRNLNIQGGHTGLDGIKITGAATGTEVEIQDCMISDSFAGNGSHAIFDQRSGGGELYVQNTLINDIGSGGANFGEGIEVSPLSGSAHIHAFLDGDHIENTGIGLRTKAGVQASVRNSFFTGSANAGVLAENDSNVNLDQVVSSGNGVGLQTGGTAVMRIGDSDITDNTTGITGTVGTYGTNRIWGNGAAGTAPTDVGPASAAKGQQ